MSVVEVELDVMNDSLVTDLSAFSRRVMLLLSVGAAWVMVMAAARARAIAMVLLVRRIYIHNLC